MFNFVIKSKCNHDLPFAYNWQNSVFRCSSCNCIFESVMVDHGIYYECLWRKRSERWLEKRINKGLDYLVNRKRKTLGGYFGLFNRNSRMHQLQEILGETNNKRTQTKTLSHLSYCTRATSAKTTRIKRNF